MKLLGFGCSFIYGNELKDCVTSASQLTWPALVAAATDLPYQCHARAGSGNLQILHSVLNQLHQDCVFVVNWTWIDRFDYVVRDRDDWQTILPNDRDVVGNFYYKNLHSEYRDKFMSLICIDTAINMLQANQRKFIMTYMDALFLDQTWHTDAAMRALQQRVTPYLHCFDGDTFLEWSKKQGYAISAKWHPLEEAHAAAAVVMTPIIDAIQHRA